MGYCLTPNACGGDDRIEELEAKNRAFRQALTWCVVNDGETLGDHPRLLQRFREILGIEGQTNA